MAAFSSQKYSEPRFHMETGFFSGQSFRLAVDSRATGIFRKGMPRRFRAVSPALRRAERGAPGFRRVCKECRRQACGDHPKTMRACGGKYLQCGTGIERKRSLKIREEYDIILTTLCGGLLSCSGKGWLLFFWQSSSASASCPRFPLPMRKTCPMPSPWISPTRSSPSTARPTAASFGRCSARPA